jgi:hypothetical protein
MLSERPTSRGFPAVQPRPPRQRRSPPGPADLQRPSARSGKCRIRHRANCSLVRCGHRYRTRSIPQRREVKTARRGPVHRRLARAGPQGSPGTRDERVDSGDGTVFLASNQSPGFREYAPTPATQPRVRSNPGHSAGVGMLRLTAIGLAIFKMLHCLFVKHLCPFRYKFVVVISEQRSRAESTFQHFR